MVRELQGARMGGKEGRGWMELFCKLQKKTNAHCSKKSKKASRYAITQAIAVTFPRIPVQVPFLWNPFLTHLPLRRPPSHPIACALRHTSVTLAPQSTDGPPVGPTCSGFREGRNLGSWLQLMSR